MDGIHNLTLEQALANARADIEAAKLADHVASHYPSSALDVAIALHLKADQSVRLATLIAKFSGE